MDTALHRPVEFSGFRLASWITFSIAAHMLVLALWGKGALHVPAASGLPVLTADISYIAADPTVAQPPLYHTETRALVRERQPAARPRSPSEAFLRPKEPMLTPAATAQASPSPRLLADSYFGINDVEVRAEPMNDVLLHYPSMAYIRRISGVVQFRLLISARGELEKFELIKAEPPGIFERAASDAVKQLKFSPAVKYGRPVKSEKTIDVVFDPYPGSSNSTAKSPAPSVEEM
jgi:TonB family protein